jgi:hypothetical protein
MPSAVDHPTTESDARPGPPPASFSAPGPRVPLQRRRWFWPAVVGVAAFTFGAVAGGGGDEPTAGQVKASAEYTRLAAELETARAEVTTAQAAADDAKAAATTAEAKVTALEAAATAAEPADPAPAAPPAEPVTFVMPDVVGANLQLAQDTLQGLGSYVMDQQDASGAGRTQVLDSNWHVCTQSPVAGSVVPVDTIVTLASVKLAESCP